jgi:acyl carrier protein
MNKQQFEDKVRLIISEQLGADLCEVQLNATLREDLRADSLDMVELTMALEEEFDTKIQVSSFKECKTVEDIFVTFANMLNASRVAQKAAVCNVEQICGVSLADHSHITKCIPETTTGAFGEDIILDENAFAFTKIQSLAKETNLLISFDPSGKVTAYSEEDEFIVENYEQLKQVMEALKVLDSFRG